MATKGGQGKKASVQWTNSMDEILVDALLDQVMKGNRVNGQFTTSAFAEVTTDVRTKTKIDAIDKDKIKNRIKTLKKTFGEAYDAFKGLSGFGWNPLTKLFEAEEEVWDELLKSNPKAIQLKTKPVHNYDKLKELWAEDRAIGDNALTPKERLEKLSRSFLHEDISIQNIDRMVDLEEASIEGFEFESQFHSTQPHTPEETFSTQLPSHPSETQGASSNKAKVVAGGKKRKADDALMTKMESAMQNVVEAMDRASSVIERSRFRIYSGEEIYSELDKMEIDDDFKLEALEWLTENQNKFRVMIGIPTHLRTSWLEKKFKNEN